MAEVLYLRKAAEYAATAGHPFEKYAAAETGLESRYGNSELAVKYNNLFGQKQSSVLPVYSSVTLPTTEVIHNHEIETYAQWIVFPDWRSCFKYRWFHLMHMAALEVVEDGKVVPRYPGYAAAVKATNGEDFILNVSKDWSTDPERGQKVLEIYREWVKAEGWDQQPAPEASIQSPIPPPPFNPKLPIPEGLK